MIEGSGHEHLLRRDRGRSADVFSRSRGLTLIELLIVVVLAAIMMSAVVSGLGAATNAKLKASTTLIGSAVRTAFTRSSATAKNMRVVFDIDKNRLWLEESTGSVLVTTDDLSSRTGGADPATAAEKAAAEQADKILKGPRAPRPTFTPVKQSGFDAEDGKQGKELPDGIRFKEINVMHQQEPATEGRAYLYVWPGGQTELAYFQVRKGEATDEGNMMTVFVHPLTGQVRVERGAKRLPMLLGPDQVGEREDKLF